MTKTATSDRQNEDDARRAPAARKPRGTAKDLAEDAGAGDADIGETAGTIADGGDHARLLMVNGAVIGLGLVTRNAKLTRTGVRMVIAQGLAFGARTVFSQGLQSHGEQSAEAASQEPRKRDAGGDDNDDDGVATGSGAATVAVARAISATTPIPYLPARLAGLAVTGSNRPRKANVIADFAMGSAIGWLAERLAKRIVGGNDEPDDKS
jgi:hypothetical protein